MWGAQTRGARTLGRSNRNSGELPQIIICLAKSIFGYYGILFQSEFSFLTMYQEFRSGGKLGDLCYRFSTHVAIKAAPESLHHEPLVLSLTEDSLQTEVAKGLFLVPFCCLAFVIKYFASFVCMNQFARPHKFAAMLV